MDLLRDCGQKKRKSNGKSNAIHRLEPARKGNSLRAAEEGGSISFSQYLVQRRRCFVAAFPFHIQCTLPRLFHCSREYASSLAIL
jgi:hypothetical protein